MTLRCVNKRAFSLIEVVVAVAIFSTAIVAVLGLMGPLTRSAREVLDSTVAARLAGAVDRELKRGVDAAGEGIGWLWDLTDEPSEPLILYATQDGGRVVLHQDRDGGLSDGDPAPMPPDERYFALFVAKLIEPSPQLSEDEYPSYVALVIRAEWPYLPDSDDADGPVSEITRSAFAFHTAIRP